MVCLNENIWINIAKNAKMLTSAKLIFWITFDWLNFGCWNFAECKRILISTFWIKNFFRNLMTSAEISKKQVFAKICWRKQNFEKIFYLKCAYSWCPTLGKISPSKVKPIKSYSKNKFCWRQHFCIFCNIYPYNFI